MAAQEHVIAGLVKGFKDQKQINDSQQEAIERIKKRVPIEDPQSYINNYNNYNPDAQGKFVNWNSVPDSQELEARQA